MARFRTKVGVLEAIRMQGRCYSDGEVVVSFSELHAIDIQVASWLSTLRAEGLIEYEVRRFSPTRMLPPVIATHFRLVEP